MKFKKSISFVLTLCMVLSLFATFVIPASAEPTNLVAGSSNYTTSQLFRQDESYAWNPESPITYPDEDGKSLTDGVKEAANFWDAAWVGFSARCPEYQEIEHSYVTFDLGAVCEISSIVLYTFADSASGIAAPYWVNYCVSEDGENWSEIGYVDNSAGDLVITFEKETSARFVKVKIYEYGWCFLSEVEIYGTAAAPKAGLAGENVSRWEAGAEFAVLTDGDNGVGEVNNYNPFQPRLFGVASGVMEATDYTLTFVIDKAEFNTITLYALDFANGGVMLPEAVTFVVDGVKYEAAINANANGIATIVATLDEAVTANCVVAEVTMGASPYSFTIFNMFTEFEVSNELPEGAIGLDVYGYTHTSKNYVMYADADTTLGALTAKYYGSAKDLNYFKVIVVNADGTVAATYTTLGRPDGVKSDFAVTAGQIVLALSANEVNVGRFEIVDTVNVGDIVTLYNVDLTAAAGDLTNAAFTVEAAAVADDESFKETHTHVDGVNVGTIQQLGEAWADKPASDFWYLVDSGKETVTISVVVDDRAIVADDTQLRVWIETDKDYTKRTTLVDVKVKDGAAYVARIDGGFDAAVKSVTYEAVGKDYKLVLVLDKATLGITGEYGLNVQLGQTGSTTMHSIKYDNVTGEGATYAPWTTTEFYEIFDKAPVTSQVVENFNHADWNTGVNTFHAAYIFTDAEIYAGVDMMWWYHAAFAPVANGAYKVVGIAAPGSDAADNNTLEIPEGGFVWVAWTSAEAGNGKASGAYAKALMSTLKEGDLVVFNGLDIAKLTTTEDATATKIDTSADVDLLISHNYNFNWHCFEGEIISGAVADAPKFAGDAPFLKDSIEAADILYVVENVKGAYLVTGFVTGSAIPETAIPEGGFVYYVTANCTNYDKICHGELVGKYIILGDIDLATKFAIDTQAGNPAYAIQAVSSFKTGDADLDGKITATDYAIIRKLVLGTLTADDVNELALKAADVNGNGKVDARDYYLVKRAFLGTYVIPGWEAEDAE